MTHRLFPRAILAILLLALAGLAQAQELAQNQPQNQSLWPSPDQNTGGHLQPFSGSPPAGLSPGDPPPGGLPPGLATPPLIPVMLATPPAPVVVELFTSEGCSSCPAANDYLRALSQRKNLLPLSFHVDYWDYTGWKDRFADAAFARRQRAYAAAKGKTIVYTPQMVIGGAIEVLGSDRGTVEKALLAAERRHAMYALGIAKDAAGGIHLSLPTAALSVPASLWLVTYNYRDASDIRAGENRGTRMITTNVVRSLRQIGTWDGRPDERVIALTADEIAARPDACAIIANEAGSGPVVAAAAWNFKDLW